MIRPMLMGRMAATIAGFAALVPMPAEWLTVTSRSDHAPCASLFLSMHGGKKNVDGIGQRKEETVMKGLVSVLIALTLLGLASVPAGAFDAKSFYEQQSRIVGGA
jgi:hypothetical protein